MFEVIPMIYSGKNKRGDFAWMITQPEYKDYLFIFNDNVESRNSYKSGYGNACIRNYSKNNPRIKKPRSAGIPTGSFKDRGFKSLSDTAKKHIDDAIDEIKQICSEISYKGLIYSAEPDGTLGSGLFKVSKDVLDYITEEISKFELK